MLRIPIQLVHAAPAGPPAAQADSPLWGHPETLALSRNPILTDSVDSISAGTQEERVAVAHASAGAWVPGQGPLPRGLWGTAMQERLGVATRTREPLPRPYGTDVRRGDPTFARPVFALRYRDPHPVAELFNHPGGMRGHYFVSAVAGDGFARELITRLMSLLLAVVRDWSGPGPGSWLEQDEAMLRASLLQGKVWMTEPYGIEGTLADHGWGNPNWVLRTDPRAVARRRGFIAAVRQAEGDDARTAAFLAAATNEEGLLGRDENLGGADVWRGQNAGARFMGTRGVYTVEIKGAFVDRHAATWTPLRKTHNALSLHWLGFS